MTTRDIQRHLRELYGVDVSDGLISEVTASIQDDVRAWQSRPLEELYVVVYLDAMQVSIREQQVVRKKAVYVAIGVTLEGERDCLGPLDRKDRGRPLLDQRADRAPQPRRHATSCSSAPTASRASRRRSTRSSRWRSTRPASSTSSARASLPLLPGAQACASELRRIYTAADADAARAGAGRAHRRLGRLQDPHRRARRSGNAPGTGSSRSSPSPKRSAASSTPPTPSRACTCRSARRSRPAATSPTTTPRSD